MIVSKLRKPMRVNNSTTTTLTLPELVNLSTSSISGQSVTAETCKNISTAYRCINVLSDDVAKMPLQEFTSRMPGLIERVRPSSRMQNLAWLMEVAPNRNMTPFVFKKAVIMWLITWGNAYVWQPALRPGQRRELFLLKSDRTFPVYDLDGNVWYQTLLANEVEYLPGVEVFHLRINAADGITGTSVVSYARETLGRQMGARDTQARFYSQGLNPGGILWASGELNRDARQKMRESYEEAMSGSSNAYRLAIMDQKVTKFEQITMKPVDAQFLESIAENDLEIANFFGMPLHKLNMGKQSYSSNEQQNLDYLQTTLDPYLVQYEQEAALKWLTEEEQMVAYLRFNRDSLLRTDAKTRSEVISQRIGSGVLSPNEGRAIDDLSAYPGGDGYYLPVNLAEVGAKTEEVSE